MHPRTSPPGSPRLTSYAPATGLPPPASQAEAAAPAPAATHGGARAPKRAREDDDKASSNASSASSSSGASGEAGPLARRAQPLTTAVTSADPDAFDAFARYASPRAAGGARSTLAFAPLPRPRPLTRYRAMPPDEILARITAFAASRDPRAYFAGLRRRLGHREAPPPGAEKELLRLRPDALLRWPAPFRTPAAWRAYFEARGTLAAVPEAERTLSCCEAAIERWPCMLKDVPQALRSLALCKEAVGRDGYALQFVPAALLAAGSAHREMLYELAFASGHPPRFFQHLPPDQRTRDRAVASLRRMPLDLILMQGEFMTEAMALEAIRQTPPGVTPPYDVIPMRLRGQAVVQAILARSAQEGEWFPAPDWYPPPLRSREVMERFMQSTDDRPAHDPGKFLRDAVKRGEMTLDMFVTLLRCDPEKFLRCLNHWHGRIKLHELAHAMQVAIEAAGFAPGQRLDGPGWPLDQLPADNSPEEICRWAGRFTPFDWKSLPDSLRGEYEVCRGGLGRWHPNIHHVPPDTLIRHPDLIELAVQAEPQWDAHQFRYPRGDCTLARLPREVLRALDPTQLDRLCRMTLSRSGWPLGDVLAIAGDRLSPGTVAELAEKAALQGCNWRDIPASLQEALRLPALRHNGRNLAHMPEQDCTREWCEAALGHTIAAWSHVPARFREPALLERVRFTLDSLKGMKEVEGLPKEFVTRILREYGPLYSLIPFGHMTVELFKASLLVDPSGMNALHVSGEDWRNEIYPALLKERPDRILQASINVEDRWLLYACRMGADPAAVSRWVSRNSNLVEYMQFFDGLEDLRVQGFLPQAATPVGPPALFATASSSSSSSSSAAASRPS